MAYSDRQRAALQLRRRPLVRRHLFDGATRSGKTYSVIPGFINWALSYPHEALYLAASKTWRQINEIIVPEFERHAESLGMDLIEEKGDRALRVGHARFLLAEGDKYDSPAKIKGFKFRGSLLEEVTEMTEAFVLMAESRCLTYGDWKTVMTCNPEGPGHWVKLRYLDPAQAGDPLYERIPFLIRDNPTMTEDDIESLFRNNSWLWKQRMLYGKWVAATGAVYHTYQTGDPPDRQPNLRWVGLDYAQASVMHASLFEQYGLQAYLVDEKRYDGRTAGPLDMAAKARLIRDWLGERPVAGFLVDPSTPNQFKQLLADMTGVVVINAPNDIYDGVNAMAAWLENGDLIVSERCRQTILELGAYVWDERAAARGESVPVKGNDHGMDADRYGIAGYPLIIKHAPQALQMEHSMDQAA